MKLNFEFNLPVSIFKEGKYFIAYTPALDISTCGETFEEVQKRFHEVVKIFFEETTRKETLKEILEELGWRKLRKQWSPPPIIAHEPQHMKIAVSA